MEWCTVFPLKVARFHSVHERPSGRKVCRPLLSAMGKRTVFPMKFTIFRSYARVARATHRSLQPRPEPIGNRPEHVSPHALRRERRVAAGVSERISEEEMIR